MLPAKNRLNKGLFINIYRQGKRGYGTNLNLVYAVNKYDFSRFGFVVSKKNAKKAVERNKIKRIMRETVRQELKSGFIASGYDIIINFVGKKSRLSDKEMSIIIKREIELLFSRASLAKK
jgi:ribonuclease P protein component